MLRAYRLSPTVIFSAISFLICGQLLCGTSPLFVALMAVCMLCIGVTYNLLGGLSTFSGILFAVFSLDSIVVSQFAKVFLFQAADTSIDVPLLTITAYALCYVCILTGVFIYGQLRITDLPKPLETTSGEQSSVVYFGALGVGVIANFFFQSRLTLGNTGEQEFGAERSFGLIFSALLLFALVLAVDARIRNTNGAHSFDWKAFVPWLLTAFFGFVDSSRSAMMTSTVAYFATCYLRGYRFKRRHFVTAVIGGVLFSVYISPFAIYERYSLYGLQFQSRVYEAFHLLLTVPNRATIALATENATQINSGRAEYYGGAPGTYILNRLSVIREDSLIFAACANGYHYGWTSIKTDILINVPRFLYKNKPDTDSAAFVGRVTGMNPDAETNNENVFSPIGDAFGGFGFLGVAAFGFCVLPLMFVILESIFDMGKPWGTVAIGMLLPLFGEGSAGSYIVNIYRIPIYLILLSLVVGGIARMFPTRGDRPWLPQFEPAGESSDE
ncbi:MAG TPA: hypothetical protein VMA34_01610 [Terracidiphilus sp.]|nr:hypothetical protein [Terracidiphilus sp.]